MSNQVHIPFHDALVMIGSYARRRVLEQVRSVAFVVVYLFLFQLLVLRSAPADAFRLAGGIFLVILGLTLFLEGVVLGLMPLGERVGVTLPSRFGITLIVVFAVLIGIGTTLAEPAIAILRTVGANVTAWEAPLLYVLLQRYPDYLILAISLGVGIAVAIGVARFYYGFSIKPLILILIPPLLILTVLYSLHPNLSTIVGLAWDSGAVTTGPVTVPLVLAVGIGVSRATGRSGGASNGFGVIMLASALPVLAVLILGAAIERNVPEPVSEEVFFSEEYREQALRIFQSEEDLLQHGRESEHNRSSATKSILQVLREEVGPASRAVIPLTVLLLLVLFLFLRERPRYYDEVVFGIVLALVGMILLTAGIRVGLAPLGDSVGRELPRAYRTTEEDMDRIVIDDFDPDLLQESVDSGGVRRRFFYFHQDGRPRPMEFQEQQYDQDRARYEHIVRRAPLFGPDMTAFGLGLVFLFAFGMGFGSTLAEPALKALGRTVEDLTVGTIKQSGVVRTVSIGVGLGLMAGIARILYDIPLFYLIIPTYLVLVTLSVWSEEDFTGIAWDCGGVTTGPVTVPLVLAMGLAIGGETGVTEGFGVLALASVFPNLTVLIYGFVVRSKQQRTIRYMNSGDDDG